MTTLVGRLVVVFLCCVLRNRTQDGTTCGCELVNATHGIMNGTSTNCAQEAMTRKLVTTNATG